MIDPVTALAVAANAFGTVKRMVSAGREIEDTMQYNNLKYAWCHGDIDLRHRHELYPTYVPDTGGLVNYPHKPPRY